MKRLVISSLLILVIGISLKAGTPDIEIVDIFDPQEIIFAGIDLIPKVRVINKGMETTAFIMKAIILNDRDVAIYETAQETTLSPVRSVTLCFPEFRPDREGYYKLIAEVVGGCEATKEFQVTASVMTRSMSEDHKWWPPWDYCKRRKVYHYQMLAHPQVEWDFWCDFQYYGNYLDCVKGPYREDGSSYPGWSRWHDSDEACWYSSSGYEIPRNQRAFFTAYNKWGYTGYKYDQPWWLSDGQHSGVFHGPGTKESIKVITRVLADGRGYHKDFTSDYSVDDNPNSFSIAVGDESTNWIIYDLGCEMPVTHVAIVSRDEPNYTNPKDIEIATCDFKGKVDPATLVNIFFPPLKEGAAYEIPLFENPSTKFLFTRYVRMSIISKWDSEYESSSPEGAQFSEIAFYGFPEIETGETTTRENSQEIADFTLDCNSIVPKSSILQINYKIPYNGRVILSLHDISGRKIRTLVEERGRQGSNSINWIVSDIPSGIYFLKLRTGGGLRVRKIVILR